MNNRKSDKYKGILSKRGNRTVESIRMEEVMDQKWSIHAAIKSSLDLFEKGRGKKEVENQEEEQGEEKGKKGDGVEDEGILESKIESLVRRVYFGRFRSYCQERIKRRHYDYAAKYLYESKLKRKVFTSSVWNQGSDQELSLCIQHLQHYLSNRRKKCVYSKLNNFTKTKGELQAKISILDKNIQAKMVRNQKRSVEIKGTSKKERSIEDKVRKYQQLKQYSIKKINKYQTIEQEQRESPVKSNKKQEVVVKSGESRKSVLEIKEGIKVDDIRNYLNHNRVMRCVSSIRYYLSCRKAKQLPILILTHSKQKFIKNLMFLRNSNRLKESKTISKISRALSVMWLNRNVEISRKKCLKLFLRRSYKLKKGALEILSENREKKMLSDLCFNIIMTKRMAQLESKAFASLKLNLQRRRVQAELMEGIESGRQLNLLKKTFTRWKYYRPEYLNTSYQGQELRESVGVFCKRQREETGALDLLKGEIREITLKVFFRRLRNRVERRVREREEVRRGEEILETVYWKGWGKGNLSLPSSRLIREGLKLMRTSAILSRNRYQLEYYLMKSKIKRMFKQKYLSPSKSHHLQYSLNKKAAIRVFQKFQQHIDISSSLRDKTQAVLGSRFMRKLTKRRERLQNTDTQLKYLTQLLDYSRHLKLKYRLFNQLRLRSHRSSDISYTQLPSNPVQEQFKQFVEDQSQEIKECFIAFNRKRVAWIALRNNICLQRLNERRQDEISQKILILESSIRQVQCQRVLCMLSENYTFHNQIHRLADTLAKKSFFNQLRINILRCKQSALKRCSHNKLLEYAQRKYHTRLSVKSFQTLKKHYLDSLKEQQHSLITKTFSALKDHLHQCKLLRKYLSQCPTISYYPQSLEQRQEFNSLQQYIDA